MRGNSSLTLVFFFLLLTLPLVAQDTPIGTPGTQVGTEQTPAAATNADGSVMEDMVSI